MKPTLRPYQRDTLDAILAAANPVGPRLDGLNRLLVKKPTGTGKTVTFAALPEWLKAWLALYPKRGAFMLVIAHREELLDQAAAKIQQANPGRIVSVEQGDRHASPMSDIIVASIQTLAAVKFRRLRWLLQQHTPRVVVIDEAHHAAASTYRTALVYLGFLPPADAADGEELEAPTFDDVKRMEAALHGWDHKAPKDRLLVGVTATPNRTDAIGLGCVFQSIAYSYALKQAIEDKYLVPIVPWAVETGVSLDEVKVNRGEFNQRELSDTVNTPTRNKIAIAAWRQYAEGLSTIAFSVDVAHAHAIAEAARAEGITAAAVSGETPREERRQILADYTAGKITLIANCMVLTEGTDLPRTGCILNAKPTKSATLYEQMVGRGLRIHPGKERCVVIDVVDVARKHSLQAAPVLYGLPPQLVTKGKDLKTVSNELDALREQYPNFDVDEQLARGPMTLEELGATAKSFDAWTLPSMGDLAGSVTMQWIRTGETFRVQYPWKEGDEEANEILTVGPDVLGHYDVACTLRFKDINIGGGQWVKGKPTRQRTLAAQVPTVLEALLIAERYVKDERRSVAKLTGKDEPWRNGPASDKQIKYLRRLRVPFNEKTITKGQASDMINIATQGR